MKVITSKIKYGLTLIELLAALVISSLLIIAVVAVYNQGQRVLVSVGENLEVGAALKDIEQMIAEDIDNIALPDNEAKIELETKTDSGRKICRLVISSTVYDKMNKPLNLKLVVWQTKYDEETGGIVLYRASKGLQPEDPILDTQVKEYENSVLFVPICDGMTMCQFVIVSGEQELEAWNKTELPKSITLKMSFAEPIETITGDIEVPEEDIVKRTVAIDRARDISFVIVPYSTDVADSNSVEEDDQKKEDEDKQEVEESEEDKSRDEESELEETSEEDQD